MPSEQVRIFLLLLSLDITKKLVTFVSLLKGLHISLQIGLKMCVPHAFAYSQTPCSVVTPRGSRKQVVSCCPALALEDGPSFRKRLGTRLTHFDTI